MKQKKELYQVDQTLENQISDIKNKLNKTKGVLDLMMAGAPDKDKAVAELKQRDKKSNRKQTPTKKRVAKEKETGGAGEN